MAKQVTNQTWLFSNFASTQAALDFLNAVPRRGPGEACAVARGDGTVGVFFLDPGSLDSSTAQTWLFQSFTGPGATGTATQAMQDGMNFLNTPPRRGPGEAIVNVNATGSVVGVFYLDPGTLDVRTMPDWEYFYLPITTAETTEMLNAVERQGAGQVSAMARNDGSVGLYYLTPGSLEAITAPTWEYQNFTGAPGITAIEQALSFLNEAPRQGPGEVSANARNDGSVGLFYLEQ
jgi:hypothetical protein